MMEQQIRSITLEALLESIPPQDDRQAETLTLLQSAHRAHQMEVFIRRTDEFGYGRKAGDKMPRANVWRPYRFAVQDVILACTVMRHSKERNCIEVDAFLASDPSYRSNADVPEGQHLHPYEPLAAAKALTLMLLSEAFRCGAEIALRFTENVERSDMERAGGSKWGRVPLDVLQLALKYETPLPDVESGVLKPNEAVPLYAALTGFPARLRARIESLAGDGLLTLERACYLVQHGVWTVPELEGVITSCPYPDLVLDGEIQPEARHLYHHVQVHTRTALLGGVLDRALLARDPPFAGNVNEALRRPKGRAEGAVALADTVGGRPTKPGKDVEDDDLDLSIEYDPEHGARVYRLGPREDAMRLPDWRPFAARNGDPPWAAGVGREDRLLALLRPRDAAGLLQFLAADINAAENCRSGERDYVAVVVPLDFDDLPADEQRVRLKQAADARVWLLVCPETVRALDGYAREKLNRSRVLPE